MNNNDLLKYGYNSSSNNEWMKFLRTNHLENRALHSEIFQNILLIPDVGTKLGAFCGGGFDEGGNPVLPFFQRRGVQTAKELYERGFKDSPEVIKETVVFLGQIRNHWGSFLFDSITRLWYARENVGALKYVFLRTQIEVGDIHENCFRFLELYGISKDQIIIIEEPTLLSEVIVPELSLLPFEKWHTEYLDTIHSVVDCAKPDPKFAFEKVYFSRAKFAKKYKSDFGNELIRDFFEINGFQVIYPEELTLDQQIAVVNHCKVFASVCGAGAHNVIFSKNRPKTILVKRMNGYQEHQWFFDEMAGVEPVTYIDAYSEPFKAIYATGMGGPYLFLINKNIRLFAKDNNMCLPPHWRIRNAVSFVKYAFACIKSMGSRIKRRILRRKST